VLTAEIGQIVLSLALATLGRRPAPAGCCTPAWDATVIALMGNVQVALPGHSDSPFAWLVAIAPPLLVLSTAYVLKEQMLEVIELRHANERAYQEAVNEWQRATVNPEQHSQWMQFYANALRDALRKANSRRREVLEGLSTADWRALVYRELQADNWYEQPALEVQVSSVEPRVNAEQHPLALMPNGSEGQPIRDGV
jgi:hypothetical protein